PTPMCGLHRAVKGLSGVNPQLLRGSLWLGGGPFISQATVTLAVYRRSPKAPAEMCGECTV
ncbi:MAG: hypothetical protein ABF409_02530, partial [Bifidobacterium sp.]|uniref:hypothetical protein n=1 Tax=Bifidobacterium sp. TaxID=41200 RepID=UPI0039E7720C